MLCLPTIIYLAMSIFSIVIAILNKAKPISVVIKICFVLLWSYFLQYMCTNGFESISWLLVLFPFIFMLGMFAIAFETMCMAPPPSPPSSHHKQNNYMM